MKSIVRLDLGEGPRPNTPTGSSTSSQLACWGGTTGALGTPQIFFEAGDITQQATDAIVNAANSSLMGGGGVDGAIHRAGGPAILEECRNIVARDGHLPPGEAVQTTGGNLKAAFVIHTVGPIWRDGMQGESGILASAYRNSMRLADRLGLHSIAFPSISTGAYRYPPDQAASVAVPSVVDALTAARNLHEVRFVLFSDEMLHTYLQAAKELQQRRSAAHWSFATLEVDTQNS